MPLCWHFCISEEVISRSCISKLLLFFMRVYAHVQGQESYLLGRKPSRLSRVVDSTRVQGFFQNLCTRWMSAHAHIGFMVTYIVIRFGTACWCVHVYMNRIRRVLIIQLGAGAAINGNIAQQPKLAAVYETLVSLIAPYRSRTMSCSRYWKALRHTYSLFTCFWLVGLRVQLDKHEFVPRHTGIEIKMNSHRLYKGVGNDDPKVSMLYLQALFPGTHHRGLDWQYCATVHVHISPGLL